MVSTAAANETDKIDPAHSSIGFHLGHMLGKVVGKFTKFEGRIDIDREHPQQSSVTVRIQVGSSDTGIHKRDEHLRSVEFFDVAKYPEITFKSRSVKQTGAQSGDILGDLTMHGVTKPVTLAVTARPRSTMPGAYAAASRPPRQSIGGTLAFFGTSRARVPVSSWETTLKSPSMLSWCFSPNRAKAGEGHWGPKKRGAGANSEASSAGVPIRSPEVEATRLNRVGCAIFV